MGLLRPRGNVDPRFLSLAYRSPQFQSELAKRSIQGATVDRIPIGEMDKWHISLPPLDEQRRIAGVLGALDDLIDTNERSAQAIEKLLQTRFAAMEFDVDGSQKLPDVVELNPKYGKPIGDASYVDMAALPTDSYQIGEVQRRPAAGGARFMTDDALLARITPCLENGKAAFASSVPAGEVFVGSTEFIVLRARDNTPASWPYFLCRSERFREYAIRHMTGSSGRQRLSAQALESYSVDVDSERLKSFGQDAGVLMASADELNRENSALRRTRDELLPLLMSGKVRVSPEGVNA